MKEFNASVYADEEILYIKSIRAMDLDTAMTIALTTVNQDNTLNFYQKNGQRLMITVTAEDESESATQML